MIAVDPLVVLASALSAVAAVLITRRLVPPPRRLASRIRPYIEPSLWEVQQKRHVGPVGAVFGPMWRDAAHWIGNLLDRGSRPVTLARLRQAGWYRELGESEIIAAYRIEQLRTLLFAVIVAVGAGQVVGASLPVRAMLLSLGLTVGATRTRGRLDKAIDARRELMGVEIYTVNQLLAMRVRAGGGVIQAVRATTARGRGNVIDELEEALRLHSAGWPAADAFRRIAELTPEPFCSRTYRLLASAEERGANLGRALLALSEDVRETRRESVKRTATKRRAAMLVPTIAILAPVLILFVAAPLPYLITSWQ